MELRPLIDCGLRGSFLESYHHAKFADLGIKETFPQDNHSISSRGTLRGLHYHLCHRQAKLCRVVEGEALEADNSKLADLQQHFRPRYWPK